MDTREKILKIMQAEEMNALQFASEIGIQSSTLSHILNGRNKPSLEVIKKILNRFRTINADWLILDSGTIYRQEKHSQTPSLFPPDEENTSIPKSYANEKELNFKKENSPEKIEMPIINDTVNKNSMKFPEEIITTKVTDKSVSKIIVYYTDKTFQEFIPG
jgi:transcriptional regulator with XRE-family HTH domain